MIDQTARLKADAAGDGGRLAARRDQVVLQLRRLPRGALALLAGDEDPGGLNVERARDARNVSLGAYYRLRPNLNTYHAALHETGAVLVSAELHDGWLHDDVASANGRDRAAAARRPQPARAARSTPSSSSATPARVSWC